MSEREQSGVWIFGAPPEPEEPVLPSVREDDGEADVFADSGDDSTQNVTTGASHEAAPWTEPSSTNLKNVHSVDAVSAASPTLWVETSSSSATDVEETAQPDDRQSLPIRPPRPPRLPWLVAGALVLVLGTFATTAAVVRHGSDDRAAGPVSGSAIASRQASNEPIGNDTADSSAPSAPSTSASDQMVETPSPSDGDDTSAATVEDRAKDSLEQLSDDGLERVSLDGQDVAMIASKWNGVRDPLQKTRSGSHVFGYSDILTEYERLLSGDNNGADLVILRGSDYGKHRNSPNGKTIYVTFAIGSFDSRDEVEDWCKERFAGLSKAERENGCVPTRLTD